MRLESEIDIAILITLKLIFEGNAPTSCLSISRQKAYRAKISISITHCKMLQLSPPNAWWALGFPSWVFYIHSNLFTWSFHNRTGHMVSPVSLLYLLFVVLCAPRISQLFTVKLNMFVSSEQMIQTGTGCQLSSFSFQIWYLWALAWPHAQYRFFKIVIGKTRNK